MGTPGKQEPFTLVVDTLGVDVIVDKSVDKTVDKTITKAWSEK